MGPTGQHSLDALEASQAHRAACPVLLCQQKQFAKKPFLPFLFRERAGTLSLKQLGREGRLELSKETKASTAWETKTPNKKQPLPSIDSEGNGS